MAIIERTLPDKLLVVFDTEVEGRLRGIAFYREHQIVKDGVVISRTAGDAEPVAIAEQSGLDLAPIIGSIGLAATTLAEVKDSELRAAQEELQAVRTELKIKADAAEAAEANVTALQAALSEAKAATSALEASVQKLQNDLAVSTAEGNVSQKSLDEALLKISELTPSGSSSITENSDQEP